jgi:hypothetical protein
MSRHNALTHPRLHALYCHRVLCARRDDSELWELERAGWATAKKHPLYRASAIFRLTDAGHEAARILFK